MKQYYSSYNCQDNSPIIRQYIAMILLVTIGVLIGIIGTRAVQGNVTNPDHVLNQPIY